MGECRLETSLAGSFKNMLNPTSQPQTTTQRIARRVLVVVCGVLAIGMVGAVSVRGGSSDDQVIHVQPEPAMLAAEHETNAARSDDFSTAVEETSHLPVELASAVQPAMHVRVVRMLVTAYCPCKICCGPNAHGVTASGKPVSYNDGHFVAADTRMLPFGTQLLIPGYDSDNPVPVIDRGGAIKGNRLDVFFPTHEQAREWGRRWVMVTVMD
jgi:3D (Asp-Asp-Asp) domain-containing protein